MQNSKKYIIVIEKLKKAIKTRKISKEDIQNRSDKYEEIKIILWNINNIPKTIRTIYTHTNKYTSMISKDMEINHNINAIIDAIVTNN